MKSYITAEDIDNNKLTINKQLETIVIDKIKNLLSLKLREYKKRLSLDTEFINKSEDERKQLIFAAKNQFKDEIVNSDELKEFKQSQLEILQAKSENYYLIRETLNGLNELNEFSADIERAQLQTYDEQKTFEDLIKLELNYSEKFKTYFNIRKNNIQKYLDLYKNKRLPFHEKDDELYSKLNELYQITKDYDDIDFYDKFGMITNLDVSNQLGDYYLSNLVNHDIKTDNIINNRVSEKKLLNVSGVKNSRNIISNKLLGILLLNHNNASVEARTSFVSTNMVTCYESMYTTTKTNKYTFVTRTLGELILTITDPKYSELSKAERKQIYMTYDGSRPSSDEYYKWNGLQVFDIDLKEWQQVNTHIKQFKKLLFDELSKYHWFLCIAISASGKGLHIYTKVSPAHHVYTELKNNEQISKYWFTVNYCTKVSLLFNVIRKINDSKQNSIKFNQADFNDNFELRFVDNVVRRITAGIRLTSDLDLLVNENFIDMHPAVNLFESFDFKDIKNLLFRDTTFNQKLIEDINNNLRLTTEQKQEQEDQNILNLENYEFKGDFTNIKPLPRNSINYIVRYNVCNTLAAMFGKDGLQIAHKLLQSDVCKNVGEINSFYSCALSNTKQPSKIGLDILHKAGIIKTVKPELKQYTDNIFKNGIKQAIESVSKSTDIEYTLKLKNHEYLGDRDDYLLDDKNGGFTNKKINILLSPPGSGKTQFLLKLAQQGKRILLVEPFISVIKNKVECDEKLMKIFQVFYDSHSLNDVDYGVNAITTFDKFSICNYEKISRMFDYICIDESHLLFTSSYRIAATSNAVRKIKDIFYISSNDPFAGKIILMTGTETGDTYFFGDQANIINVYKQSLDKEMKFLICDDMLDSITRLSHEAAKLINKKYRLLIPTNKGEIYSHKLIGMVEHLLGRPIKYGYYKRSNTEQEICRLINQSNTVGDYEIIFCSNYLSVGVDIVDKLKFASIYFGPFSGYEIEQFNARIRRTGIKSIYCIQTESADGTTNDLLLEEPKLSLRLTEEDVENFTDDKQIASAKQEFIAQYDPVLHKITTPGFGYLNGAIRFNKEEYELVMFEQKFLESMIHPIKVAKELIKYGYKISVSDNYEGLSEAEQEELKKIGIESAREEKVRKHNLLVGTYLDLIDNNYHITEEGLEFHGVIDWIGKHKDLIIEDRTMNDFVFIDYNIYGTPVQVFVKSKEAFEKMYSSAKYIIGKYSVTKAKELITRYVDDAGILKQKYFIRAINLMKLIDKADSNELSEPMFNTLEKMYTWMDKFHINKGYRISYNTYMADVDAWTNSYIDMLNIKISTVYGFQKIKDNILEMLNDLGTKNTTKEGIRFDYNVLPNEDGSLVKYRKSVDTMIETMFNITNDAVSKNKKPREKHITLQKQEF